MASLCIRCILPDVHCFIAAMLNVTEILERLDELSKKIDEKTTEITQLELINTQQVAITHKGIPYYMLTVSPPPHCIFSL